ncbi:hypothetical protein [Sphingorhabdus sp.]|uniref:hypothetical protein n=1 Tax=Sphingorhabdus sp. TaxID=1902408 RepID=UPI0032B875C3
MDNIQKSVVAVLCVAAFAALIIPSASSFKTDQASAPAAPESAPKPVNAQETAVAPEEGDEFALQDETDEGPDEFETFGQPMNDAQPLGVGSDSIKQDSPQRNLPEGALSTSSTVGENYADQFAAGSNDVAIRTNQPVE